jgi:soluble lytic murein transglycosylase
MSLLDARLLCAVVTCSLVTSHARANPEPALAHVVERGGAVAGRFDLAAVDPSPEVGKVRAARAQGSHDRAAQLARQARGKAQGAERARLEWLLAHAERGAGRPAQALPWLASVAQSDHPLAPWAAVLKGEALQDIRPEEAVAAVAPVTGMRWAGQERARLVHARALLALGRADEAVPELRALVAATPGHVGAASPGMPLAEWLERSEDPERLEEAFALYRRVATRAPLTLAGRQAAERARQVWARLPPERRGPEAELRIEDGFARAHALFGSLRHADAEAAFEALARDAADPERRCEAQLFQGKAMLRRRERTEGAKLLLGVAEGCTDPDVRARARFLAAQAHSRRGDNAAAIAHFAVVEKEAPDHRLADDALFLAALAARDDGDVDGMVRRLEALPDRYPRGDMREEALFRLAWRARAAKDHEGALQHLERLLQDGHDGHQEGEVGRVAYWRARTLQDAGRTGEAARAYVEVIQRWPLGYHAQHALTRLDALDARRAAEVRATFSVERDVRAPLTFVRRSELDDPAFVRAVELLRVGDVELATVELQHLGALGAGADPTLMWVVAALLDRSGALPQASRLARARLASFRRTVPVGTARALWRIAYPRAFSPLIEQVAQADSVPPAFVRAVAREESAFDPSAVSVAHARGLIQLMGPTAQRFAKDLGVPSDPASLHRPEVNLRIGTRFIRYLFDRYRANPALVPAAYNAGESACNRWLKQRPHLALDEWVEEIPYDETRRYTRRVLETWGIYRYLDEGELATLSAELPR